MKKLVLFAIVIFMSASSVFAQGQYMKEGEYGFVIGAGFQTTEDSNNEIKSINLAFGIDGKIDVGIQAGKLNGASIYSPFLNFYILNENNLRGNYFTLKGFFKPEFLVTRGRTESLNSLGGTISKKLYLSENVGFSPTFSLLYVLSDIVNGKAIHSGISLFAGDKTVKQFSIEISTFQNNTSFDISFSLLFKGKRSSSSNNDTYKLD